MNAVSKSLACLVFAIFSSQSMAIVKTVPNTLGDVITMPSKVLGQERSIKIHLPQGYHESSKRYPVLYVLDGQWHFTNAVAIGQAVKVPSTLPEMIVVGIENSNPLRRKLFGRDSAKFENYLVDEVLPFVDAKYRTSSKRILFGWEMSAFFASFAVVDDKQLFDGIILTNGGKISVKDMRDFNKKTMKSQRYVYVANSAKDVYTINHGERLAKILQEQASETIHWKYERFDDEVHQSLPYLAMYHGLKHYFQYFPTPTFSGIDDYVKRGGMPYLIKYFAKRGERFGLKAEIADDTKNHLIWLAWKRNNYEYFDKFMTAFSDVLSTKRYDSVFWQNNFGRFYLKHNNLNVAEQYFINAIVKFSDSARLHQGLSEVYIAQGKTSLARESLEKTVELATASNDSRLSDYKTQLNALK